MFSLYNPGVSDAPLELEIPRDAPWAEALRSWWLLAPEGLRRGFYRQAARLGMSTAWAQMDAPVEMDLELEDDPERTEVETTSAEQNQAELRELQRIWDLATDDEDDRDA